MANNADTVEASQAAEVVVKQVVAYHNESRKKLSLLLLGVLILIGLLSTFIFLQFVIRPKPVHFNLNNNLQIIDPIPLNQEGITKSALLNWINEVLMEAFSYNYSNQDKQRAKLAPYMSEAALDSYVRLLEIDEDLSEVKELRYVVSIQPKAAPEILVSRAFRDRYAWQIRIPARVNFTNALVKQSQQVIVEFLVLRVPETESPLGILIAGINFKVQSRTNREAVR